MSAQFPCVGFDLYYRCPAMSEADTIAQSPGSWTVSCARCRGLIVVGPEHVKWELTCPHCQHPVADFTPAGIAVISSRSKVVAGVLGIIFGCWGVHRFYLGYTGIGILQLVLFFVTFGISSIWGIIEGILCLVGAMRDADGLPLK